jgi:hypothetical protein
MKHIFTVGCLVVLGFIGLCVYWYINPHNAPSWMRGTRSGWELRAPQSPVSGFRAPQF